MSSNSNALSGRQLTELKVATHMADVTKLSLDAGHMNTRLGDSAWVPHQELDRAGYTVAEIAMEIERTMVGGHLQEQMDLEHNRFLLVDNRRKSRARLAGVTVANNEINPQGHPETIVRAFSAGTDTDYSTLCENTARCMAEKIIEMANEHARAIEVNMRSGDVYNARAAVRFELFYGLEPTIEALGVNVALKKVMRKLQPLIDGPARTQSGYGEKMDAVGEVLTAMDTDMPKHPVTRAMIDGWPRMKTASESPLGADDSFYRSQQKTAVAARHLLSGLMKGVSDSGDHLFAGHEEIELDPPTVNENVDGSFLMTVRLKGGHGVGTVEFSPADLKDEDPTITFKDFSHSSSAISHLAAECIRVAGSGKWMVKMAS